ncbi:uncharacterized protein LOC103716409 isoform X2 [Phoenix dactylifera]|uniref:Uncharacterized protein LOC103716409 isoform X2 n=1 Tax=Phoenix dactylifera TaxID=42345 RepID=A0A8B7CMW4_PHODC|nr:uncharacterized protein LOC103716409 isoform X2 [Phoenix dactylifera]
MATSAALFLSPAPACFSRASHLSRSRLLSLRVAKQIRIRCVSSSLDSSNASAVVEKSSSSLKADKWQWKFDGNSVNVYYEEHEGGSAASAKNILMIPTISDVSTVEEWRAVAKDIVARVEVQCHATIVDWPGLGYSDRPSLNYNADIMEDFLVQFMNAPDSPLTNSDSILPPMNCLSSMTCLGEKEEDLGESADPHAELVIFGGGHAATIALRAAGKGLIKASAIAAVAPTWAGPLPIVFGRTAPMESRYGFLRGTLRAPAVGWMMYNVLVSNEKAIESQYKSHVYADTDNVTPSIVQSRYALTKQKGARYVPAAFLTGLLDPVTSREEFLKLFGELDGKMPILVVSTANAPKRSKAEMDALRGAKGVTKFVEVPGALLPQEEYPFTVAEELYKFLQESFA